MPDFDEVDAKLLELLQANDRLSLQELGETAGVAASTVNDRLKRLAKRGIITGHHARLDPEAVGRGLLAFLFVAWADPSVEAEFLERVKRSSSVLECHHVTGEWNYLLKVRVAGTRALESFLAETIKAVGGVTRTQTIIALSTAKETIALPIA
ncbi:MAG: Lrp/AsnC family transcriptional regulator [Hyphomonadaceae bacterium]|nr:Lrp/AsnC family transcriptional regulator [Hyphomonadaceae bacterium]